ncbi:MAG: hypothetical protein LBI65_03520 [Candidatus Symbiothrix sp.]|nr:hypothetical protein [Candidatus Symbiothrix sp.]
MEKKYFLKAVLALILVAGSFACSDDGKKSLDLENDSISGTLSYNREIGRWEIRSFVSGTIDSVNIYIIRNYDIDSDTNTQKKVKATGAVSPKDEAAPAGTIIYYLDLETIIYE